jgi:hypothetical protein
MQFNKRDLEDISTLEEMNEKLNKLNGPFYEAVAKDGIGVEETLQAISGLVLKSVIDRYGGDRNMTPLGRPANDPARTDPDAVAAAPVGKAGKTSAELGAAGESDAMRPVGLVGGRGRGGSGGGMPAKTSKAAATTWPSAPEEDNVPSDDGNPLDGFESLNIEGILDEALKLDDSEDEPAKPARAAAPKSDPGVEEDSMFSGLLDEALGAQETESILDSVLGTPEAKRHNTNPPPSDDNPMSGFGAELLGVERFDEAPRDQGSRPDLSELIKTRVSIPTDKVVTHKPAEAKLRDRGREKRDKDDAVSVSETRDSRDRIEVPVTLHVDASDLDRDIELVLKIRLKRKDT